MNSKYNHRGVPRSFEPPQTIQEMEMDEEIEICLDGEQSHKSHDNVMFVEQGSGAHGDGPSSYAESSAASTLSSSTWGPMKKLMKKIQKPKQRTTTTVEDDDDDGRPAPSYYHDMNVMPTSVASALGLQQQQQQQEDEEGQEQQQNQKQQEQDLERSTGSTCSRSCIETMMMPTAEPEIGPDEYERMFRQEQERENQQQQQRQDSSSGSGSSSSSNPFSKISEEDGYGSGYDAGTSAGSKTTTRAAQLKPSSDRYSPGIYLMPAGAAGDAAAAGASITTTSNRLHSAEDPRNGTKSSVGGDAGGGGGILGGISLLPAVACAACAALGLPRTESAVTKNTTCSRSCVEIMMDEPETSQVNPEDCEKMFGDAARLAQMDDHGQLQQQQQQQKKNADSGGASIVSSSTPKRNPSNKSSSSSPEGKVSLSGDTIASSGADSKSCSSAIDAEAIMKDVGGDEDTTKDNDNDGNEESDDDDNAKPRCTRRRWETILLVMLIILALVTMIALGVGAAKKRNKNSTDAASVSAGTNNDNSGGGLTGSDGGSGIPGVGSSYGQEADSSDNSIPEPDPTNAHVTPANINFESGNEIKIWFSIGEDATPQLDDWIAIYGVDMYYFSYQYTCNQVLPCTNVTLPSNGYVAFDEEAVTSAESFWPIMPGMYEAYLYRGELPPYEILAQSFTFVVHGEGDGQGEFGDDPDASRGPTSSPSSFPTSSEPSNIPEVVAEVTSAIRALIDEDETLGAKFVRLGFHDCVGGCDGCVDMDNDSNAGLEVPIEALQGIVDEFAPVISRADIWVIAALIGAQMAQERAVENALDNDDDLDEEDIFQADFSMEWTGRQNCEDREPNGECFNEDNEAVECSPTKGPHRVLPKSVITTRGLFDYFDEEFGFDIQETVALMGAHTIGTLSMENSGFDGPNGWVVRKEFLDNEYFRQMVGGDSLDDPIEELVESAPLWVRNFQRDFKGVEGQDQMVWRAFPDVGPIVMLTADISIFRDINDDNIAEVDGNGFVNCAYVTEVIRPDSDATVCPHAELSLEIAAEYKFDNDLWLNDFELVYKKMLNHGFDTSKLCPVDNPFHHRCPRVVT